MTDTDDQGKLLIQKLTEFQAMFPGLRSYSGPFDPQFPRTVFHLLFCVPLHCSIDPVESFGVLQRLMHSKDGKYLVASFGTPARFWREKATAEDVRALALLKEIREIAEKHKIWATYVDKDGSWFPAYSFMPGMLNEPPGEPVVVGVLEYLERLRVYDRSEPPVPGTLISSAMDMHDISRITGNSEIVEKMPDECRVCSVKLTERNSSAPLLLSYMKDSRQCPQCRTIYVREPTDDELTKEEAKRRDERQVVMAEFLRRIDEEFEHLRKWVKPPEAEEGSAEIEDPYGLFGGKLDLGLEDGEAWKT